MGLFRSLETSTSALTAERLRMDLIAHNLANINTTRTADGTPYRRRFLVQAERESFQSVLDRQLDRSEPAIGEGVRVVAIQEDPAPYKLKYDPSHPDADANGMVRLPNVDLLTEITDLMISSRAYEANVTAFNVSKAMMVKALEIGR
jgi:flagellar basal-body rod protein FlgC